MLYDSITLVGGATVKNLTVESGASLPVDDLAVGKLFYKTGDGVYSYTGSEWIRFATADDVGGGTADQPYDLAFSVFDKPMASEQVVRFIVPRNIKIPANFVGSRAVAETAATAQTVFVVKKNGTQIATITFGISGSTATFSTQAEVSFIAGDKLVVEAPASPDLTLANIDFTIAALLM
jgi:hypothetical protein